MTDQSAPEGEAPDKPRRGRPPIRKEATRTEVTHAGPRSEEPKRQRLRKNIASHSPTHIPPEMIPDGIDLCWVVSTIHGQPAQEQRNAFEINGWRPVLPHMFGGLFDGMFHPLGHKGEITVHGQVLMERPIELSIESRFEERREAQTARVSAERKLRSGQIDGLSPVFSVDAPNVKQVVSRGPAERLPIPE